MILALIIIAAIFYPMVAFSQAIDPNVPVMDIWPMFLTCAGAALLGIMTHYVKKMVELQNATGVAPDFVTYWQGHKWENALVILGVMGALVVSYWLGELTYYAAYMTGIAGGSVANFTGARSAQFMQTYASKQNGTPPTGP